MDFFKFNPVSSPTVLERGEIINGITRSMWVERYSAPGEFSFTCPLSSGLADFLPAGTLISHVNTAEVMIVENQEIQETEEEDSEIEITGRSFVSYLENRIVGTNQVRSSSTIAPYVLTSDEVWNQIVTMINAHIKTGTANANDALTDVQASTTLGVGTSVERTIDRGTVLDRVLELLALEELGIRTVRQGFNAGSPANTEFQIYQGVDKSADVLFSWRTGDLDAANYLLSLKNLKNSAMVVGQYVAVIVDAGPTNYDRRMMIVDANDIDGHLGAMPTTGTSPTLAQVVAAMQTRGNQQLAKQNMVTISQTDVSENTHHAYRGDYNLGDLVTLDANFSQTFIMRVIEYAEIEDENGQSGHPTLALPFV